MIPELPRPDSDAIAADVTALARVTEPGMPGWTRRALGEADREGRALVARRMARAGLDVRVDGAGNIVGRRAGTVAGPALVTGSHTDTVHGGGRFDGIVGVVGAVAAVELLAEAGVELAHDLCVVDFMGEEPNDFGLSCVGSRAITGNFGQDHLRRTDAAGREFGAALSRAGIDPSRALSARWGRRDVHLFLELHIEQGPVLEQTGQTIGVVSSVTGIRRILLTIAGRRDHSGTMPMDLRRDAACAAAEAILELERLARTGGVGTVGRAEMEPGALNVVPDLARLWVELRSVDPDWPESVMQDLASAVEAMSARRAVTVTSEPLSAEPPTPMSTGAVKAIEGAARLLGHAAVRMPSMAGHDSVQMARLAPTGMIFVPSAGGRSHCPEELSTPDDIATGVQVLAQTLVLADRVESFS